MDVGLRNLVGGSFINVWFFLNVGRFFYFFRESVGIRLGFVLF